MCKQVIDQYPFLIVHSEMSTAKDKSMPLYLLPWAFNNRFTYLLARVLRKYNNNRLKQIS